MHPTMISTSMTLNRYFKHFKDNSSKSSRITEFNLWSLKDCCLLSCCWSVSVLVFVFFFLVIMTMRFPDWRFFHLSSCVIFDTWVFLYLLLTLVIMEGGTVGLQTAGYAPNKLNFI